MSVSASQHVVAMYLDERLEALSADDSRKPEIVVGVIEGILGTLPVDVVSKKYGEKLLAAGWCYRDVLGDLTVEELVGLGVPKPHAIMVMRLLRPPIAQGQMAVGLLPNVECRPHSEVAGRRRLRSSRLSGPTTFRRCGICRRTCLLVRSTA